MGYFSVAIHLKTCYIYGRKVRVIDYYTNLLCFLFRKYSFLNLYIYEIGRCLENAFLIGTDRW